MLLFSPTGVPLFVRGRLHTGTSQEKERKLALNNFMFGDFVDSIYPIELEIRDSIKTDRSAS